MAVALIPGLPPLVDGALAAVLFVGAAFALRIVPPSMRQLLPGRRRRAMARPRIVVLTRDRTGAELGGNAIRATELARVARRRTRT